MTGTQQAIELLADALDDLQCHPEWDRAIPKVRQALDLLHQSAPLATELTKQERKNIVNLHKFGMRSFKSRPFRDLACLCAWAADELDRLTAATQSKPTQAPLSGAK